MKLPSLLFLAIIAAGPLVQAVDTGKTIPQVLQSLVDSQIAPGVVALVANKEGVVSLEKAGYASLTNKTPIRDDAIFWIASMSKSLTGAALMMLVD
jgi:CubicO group peptidase (beta-lactamase class C family)